MKGLFTFLAGCDGVTKEHILKIVDKMIGCVEDGGPGSGNFGHSGRPGKIGGSVKGKGLVSGSLGKSKSGESYKAADYSLNARGLKGSKAVKQWKSPGKSTSVMPKGTGTTAISAGDVGKGLHSVVKHLNADGTLKPEREKLHQDAVDRLFEGKSPVPEGQRKTLTFLGGGSASGKSSFTDESRSKLYGLPSKKDQAVVDSDEMKKEIPEYNDMADRDKAASFAHEESSAMAKRALEAAMANNYNVTLDGTGDGSVKSVMKKIEQARAAGYYVDACYCTRDIDAAIQSAVERGEKSGRFVDSNAVVDIHKKVSEIFPQVASEFDHVRLYDHDTPTPTLIAECYRGQEIKIIDKERYENFLNKAKYGTPEYKKPAPPPPPDPLAGKTPATLTREDMKIMTPEAMITIGKIRRAPADGSKLLADFTGLSKEMMEPVREYLQENKPKIMNQIQREEDRVTAAAAAHQAKEDAIEGLRELQGARYAWEDYRQRWNKQFDNENTRYVARPKSNPEELAQKYPRAAAYLLAQSYSGAGNYAKASAGRKAAERILNGEPHEKVIAEMEKEWEDAAHEAVMNS